LNGRKIHARTLYFPTRVVAARFLRRWSISPPLPLKFAAAS
jgi:hypothetical protein